MKTKTKTTPSIKTSIGRPFLRLIPLVLACFGLSPAAQALLPSPPPDGGYPGFNTAEGQNALFNLTTGLYNTATGYQALFSNTGGPENTATGYEALSSNIGGGANTANGYQALLHNIGGGDNTATGLAALFSNNGSLNTANGVAALEHNTTGGANTAAGVDALFSNTTANNNTAAGYYALYYNTTGNNNIALGLAAGWRLTTGNNNIDIGNTGVAGEGRTIRIGNAVPNLYPDGTMHPAQTATFIAGIHGATVAGTAVTVNNLGQLGVAPSSARFKDEIKPMDKASEAILALKPVTFRYKHELDPESIPQFGLVAEQVEKVNPDLVARDTDGKVFTVRYDAVNAMLLNEFLKEHRKLEKLTKDFESKLAQQQKQIEALTAGLQKVSAQLEASKPAPQVVNNP